MYSYCNGCIYEGVCTHRYEVSVMQAGECVKLEEDFRKRKAEEYEEKKQRLREMGADFIVIGGCEFEIWNNEEYRREEVWNYLEWVRRLRNGYKMDELQWEMFTDVTSHLSLIDRLEGNEGLRKYIKGK